LRKFQAKDPDDPVSALRSYETVVPYRYRTVRTPASGISAGTLSQELLERYGLWR
jgi:hypothetical protein